MESNHNSSNLPIEFVVKPKEDLYLEGSLRKIPRVYKGNYLRLHLIYISFLVEFINYLLFRRGSLSMSNAKESNI